MARPLHLIAVLAILTHLGARAADAPAPAIPAAADTISLKSYRPQGMLPVDLRRFLNTYGDKLSAQERNAVESEWESFNKAWCQFEATDEKVMLSALADLAAPGAAATAARAKLVELSQKYPSSFSLFRSLTGKLAKENAVRFAELYLDTAAARDVWLKSTQQMTAAINVPQGSKFIMDQYASSQRQQSIAVRQSLKAIRAWHTEIKEQTGPQVQSEMLAISRIMDYYERVDARGADRLIDQAPKTIGEDAAKRMQLQVLQRMPKRPKVVAE